MIEGSWSGFREAQKHGSYGSGSGSATLYAIVLFSLALSEKQVLLERKKGSREGSSHCVSKKTKMILLLVLKLVLLLRCTMYSTPHVPLRHSIYLFFCKEGKGRWESNINVSLGSLFCWFNRRREEKGRERSQNSGWRQFPSLPSAPGVELWVYIKDRHTNFQFGKLRIINGNS